jgi:hypothetical protein
MLFTTAAVNTSFCFYTSFSHTNTTNARRPWGCCTGNNFLLLFATASPTLMFNTNTSFIYYTGLCNNTTSASADV